MQKHRLIRRLGEPNPMDDAPDQDSAKIQKKSKLYFAYPSNPGNLYYMVMFLACPGLALDTNIFEKQFSAHEGRMIAPIEIAGDSKP